MTSDSEDLTRDHHHHQAGGTDVHADVVEGLNNKLNWLRAAVLGANDGIVSTAGVVMGVAGATEDRTALLIAGSAAVVAGALSMASGEYVSVSTQRDAERALIENEKVVLAEMPEEEFHQLREILETKGLSSDVAHQAAEQLTETNALRAHTALEYGVDIDDVANPWLAAAASAGAFLIGALLPALMILLAPDVRIWATFVAVLAALALTGWVSAKLSNAPPRRAMIRNVAGGILAMLVTLGIGSLLGTQV